MLGNKAHGSSRPLGINQAHPIGANTCVRMYMCIRQWRATPMCYVHHDCFFLLLFDLQSHISTFAATYSSVHKCMHTCIQTYISLYICMKYSTSVGMWVCMCNSLCIAAHYTFAQYILCICKASKEWDFGGKQSFCILRNANDL